MEERINRISNIKAVAWTAIVFFSLAGYYVFSNWFVPVIILMSSGLEGEIWAHPVTTLMTSGAVIGFFVLAIYGAVGILRWSVNGLAIFHATTVMMITGGLGMSAYHASEAEPWYVSEKMSVSELSSVMELISFGVALLVFVWLLIRANLMLLKADYRREFQRSSKPGKSDGAQRKANEGRIYKY